MKRGNSEIKLVREMFIKDLVLVTGFTRSGKTMLAPIISSLERAENVRMDELVEQFPMLHNLGLISDEVAIYLLRFAVTFMLYDIFIGRNANFRPSDLTSIWKTCNPAKYFERLFMDEGDVVFDRIKKENPMFVLMFHNSVQYAELLFKAFPTMKMLHLSRHPIDIIYSWYQRGYGSNFYEKPRNGTLTIQWKSKVLPLYATGWEEEYDSLSEVDRIIHMINRIQNKHNEVLNSLPNENRKKIMIIAFEKIVTDPKPVLSEICSFLNTTETSGTPLVLERERCPRILSEEERQMKLDKIKEGASSEAFSILTSMVKEYESQL